MMCVHFKVSSASLCILGLVWQFFSPWSPFCILIKSHCFYTIKSSPNLKVSCIHEYEGGLGRDPSLSVGIPLRHTTGLTQRPQQQGQKTRWYNMVGRGLGTMRANWERHCHRSTPSEETPPRKFVWHYTCITPHIRIVIKETRKEGWWHEGRYVNPRLSITFGTLLNLDSHGDWLINNNW